MVNIAEVLNLGGNIDFSGHKISLHPEEEDTQSFGQSLYALPWEPLWFATCPLQGSE